MRALIERLLRRVVQGAEVGPNNWEQAPVEMSVPTQGNAWKDAARRDLVRFRQQIAAKLRERGGFVFFHYDGDRSYCDRKSCENAAKFEALIRSHVRVIVEGPPARRGERGRGLTLAVADSASLLGKLIEVVPFYSVEAWYFQNTKQALAFCRARACRRGCEATLEAWRCDRSSLDEELGPKEKLCFGSEFNLELARKAFPDDEVLAARKSLYDLKCAFDGCAPLREALEATRPEWARASFRRGS